MNNEALIKQRQEEVSRFKVSGETPPGVFLKSAEAFTKDREFQLSNPDMSIRPRWSIGIGEDEEGDPRFTMWTEFFNDDTGELVYLSNEGYSCPPWPIHYCVG